MKTETEENRTRSRFIEVVDTVIRLNKESGRKPATQTALSAIILNDKDGISKIRTGLKEPSAEQVKKLCVLTGVAFDFFLYENITLNYNPDQFSEENLKMINDGQLISRPNIEQTNSGQNSTGIVTSGDFSGNYSRDNISSSSDTHYHFHHAQELINKIPVEYREEMSDELARIISTCQSLEESLKDKTEELKKITEFYMEENRQARDNFNVIFNDLRLERSTKDKLVQKLLDTLK
ncbi:MAG: hypothetical protein JXQ90_18185 [Cyclobacteriaceae bacterium]